MQYINWFVRFVLGSVFLIDGLNKVFEFMKTPNFTPPAKKIILAIMESGYLWEAIAGVEIVGGIFLVTGFFVPLGLVLLAPVIINIVFFHFYLDPGGVLIPFVLIIFEGHLLFYYREKFVVFFQAR